MLLDDILGSKDRPENENPEIIIKTILLVYVLKISHIFTKNMLFVAYCVTPSWAFLCP